MLEAARGRAGRRHRRRRRLRRAARPRRDRAPAGRARAAADAAGALSRHRAPGVRPRRGAAAAARDPAGRRAGALEPRRAASRRRATPSAGRTSRNCCDAGINVWTTVNVQHLESLNDLVAQITGVRQRETMPDRIFDEADEVELIDLPPDDLLARLKAGKVYVPDEVAHGRRALLPQAEPDGAARAGAAARRPTASTRRPRAALGPVSGVARLACPRPRAGRHRPGRRRPSSSCAPASAWRTRSMPSGRSSTSRRRHCCACPKRERNRRIDLLRLAESLGAETVTLDGPTAAEALLEYARTRGATRVLVGAPKRRGWRAWLRPSTATELVRRARGFDVMTIARQDRATPARRGKACRHRRRRSRCDWERYGWAAASRPRSARRSRSLMYPFLRADEPRDGLPARRDDRGTAARTRPGGH